jgi:putative Holliday junction resolvase
VDELPPRGALLGLDYGTKRFGVAVSTPDQTISSPLAICNRGEPEEDAEFLRSKVAAYSAVGLVVGLPVHMSGDEGGKAREAREFGAWASAVTGLPVVYHDERFSTAFAEYHLMIAGLTERQRKAKMDKLAAQFILASFLERRGSETST